MYTKDLIDENCHSTEKSGRMELLKKSQIQVRKAFKESKVLCVSGSCPKEI